MRNNDTVIILGAGLTGLTLALQLKRAGMKVLVLERMSTPGGVMQTISEDGFLFEAGPNTGVYNNVQLARLVKSLEPQLQMEFPVANASNRWIWKAGEWHALPSGHASAISTPLFSFRDKLRILGEPFRKPGTDPDESVASMVRRRLGKSFLDYAVDPFVSGIYAGDPERLVTRFALAKLYALEQNYGSFIKGAIQKAKEPKTQEEKSLNKSVFSFKGGLNSLIQAMYRELGPESVILNVKNIEVKPREGSFGVRWCVNSDASAPSRDTAVTGEGSSSNAGNAFSKQSHTPCMEEEIVEQVVSTIDPTSYESVFPFIPKSNLNDILDMHYAPVVQVALGYRHWDGKELNAFGGLVPGKEKRDVLGILFPSSLFHGRAPEGGAALSVFMGGMKRRDLIEKSDNDLKAIAVREVNEMLGTNADPDVVKLFKYPRAIPQYEASSGKRFETIEKLESKYPGLILAGNIRDGIGMSDRIKQAFELAQEIIHG